VAFKKTKHILRMAEFLRDLVARCVVVLSHVQGKVMVADILTKAMGRALFVALLQLLVDFAASGGAVVASVPQRGATSGGAAPGAGSGGANTGPPSGSVSTDASS
jgi:hypothetical protein